MGKIPAGALVEWSLSKNGWLQINSNRWIPASSVDVIKDIPPIQPPILDGDIRMVRFHSEMPAEEQNLGSFGIVRVYAHPKADKPHSIFPNEIFINSVRSINSAAAFQWLYEHNNTAYFGSHFDEGMFCIPAQGVFMGNLVRVLKDQNGLPFEKNGFSQIAGITGAIPAGMNHFTNPELIHFCWCVDKGGQTIPPPCKAAYHPVVNPNGMKGANVGGETQTEIWIESRWLKDIFA